MLHEFLSANRTELIDRCRVKAAARIAPKATAAELEHGIPMFMDQLIATLRMEQTRPHVDAPARLPGAAPPQTTKIGAAAMRHGKELLKQGVTIDAVVHNYGDLCQEVTGLARETGAPIEIEEFRTLNRCLDDAIAGAVTEFSQMHDSALADKSVSVERGLLHELEVHVRAAAGAMAAIKVGNVGVKGATGAMLELSVLSMRRLIVDAKKTAGSTQH